MPWPVHPNGLLGAQGDNDSYQISRSLRFNSADSATLTRTFAGAGTSKTTATISFWVKRAKLTTTQAFYQCNSTNYNLFYFNTSDVIAFSFRSGGEYYSNQVLRDTSSWYHILINYDSTNATQADRFRFYINGVRGTFLTSPAFASAYEFEGDLGVAGPKIIGDFYAGGYLANLYLAEYHFVDGQALSASSFTETDATTGRLKAKAYSGTYGNHGFYLKFADNSNNTATTLGKDSSPNGSNWTPNNFSVTAGAGNDSLVDSPTNYGTDAGVGGEARGNYCTLNPLFGTVNAIQDGALVLTGTAAGNSQRVGTMAVSSGKWYYEVTLTTLPASQDPIVGFTEINNASAVSQYPGEASSSYSIYQFSTNTYLRKVNAGSFTDTNTTSASQGDILGVALDLNSGKIWFSKNGTYVDSGNPATGANAQFTGLSGTFVPAVRGTGQLVTTTITCNFGQRPFAYTAPTGFKALCTTNLPTPTIKKPSSYFDAVAFTANNSTGSVSSLSFTPDLTWIKDRDAVGDHFLHDSIRGYGNYLSSNTTGTSAAGGGVTAQLSNGFSYAIGNTNRWISWSWDEATISGMDIVGYTGTGSATTVAHSLGVAPKMMIVKSRSRAGDNWDVYHASVGATGRLYLNLTNATDTSIAPWNNTAPTSSVFTVGTAGDTNATGVTYIAYCFAEVEGFSKFGSYIGNGSADGPFVYCGFRPKWIVFKSSSYSGADTNWIMWDTSRDPFNVMTRYLLINTTGAEATVSYGDILSNGFKFRYTDGNNNASGQTYIFAAFAESPFKYARAR